MTNSKNKIPKIIHYCWFGDGKKPHLIQKCMKSWKKYCPDWEIREWNNEDLKNCSNSYALEAARANKWAFVSDYFRLKALYEFGGVYLDTDVELTNSLDEFLNNDFFIGQENYKNFFNIQTATIGAISNNEIIKLLLNEYKNIHFIKDDGSFDMLTNPVRFCRCLEKKYPEINLHKEHELIKLDENSFIYPWWYFCKPKKNGKNFAIHHFAGSWRDNLVEKLFKKLGFKR